MWILVGIATSLALTILALFIKGGIRLVAAVATVVSIAVIEAAGLVLSGVIIAIIFAFATLVKFGIFLYQKITTKPTDVDDDANFDWMRDAHIRDE